MSFRKTRWLQSRYWMIHFHNLQLHPSVPFTNFFSKGLFLGWGRGLLKIISTLEYLSWTFPTGEKSDVTCSIKGHNASRLRQQPGHVEGRALFGRKRNYLFVCLAMTTKLLDCLHARAFDRKLVRGKKSNITSFIELTYPCLWVIKCQRCCGLVSFLLFCFVRHVLVQRAIADNVDPNFANDFI